MVVFMESKLEKCVCVYFCVMYIAATVVSELQSKVLFLQQFQMTTHFIEEVAT